MFAGVGALPQPNYSWLATSPAELDVLPPSQESGPRQESSALSRVGALTAEEDTLIRKNFAKQQAQGQVNEGPGAASRELGVMKRPAAAAGLLKRPAAAAGVLKRPAAVGREKLRRKLCSK